MCITDSTFEADVISESVSQFLGSFVSHLCVQVECDPPESWHLSQSRLVETKTVLPRCTLTLKTLVLSVSEYVVIMYALTIVIEGVLRYSVCSAKFEKMREIRKNITRGRVYVQISMHTHG